MTETLVDRTAEKNAENISDDIVTETMVKEIRVFKEFGKYKIEYLNSADEWSKLCYLCDLVDNSIEEIIDDENCIISSETIGKLEELQMKIRRIWDDSINMYKIFYRQNDNGSAELYIPLDTEHTDDIIVEKIYNCNNEFVAQNLECKIDFPLHKIETMDLYTNNLNEKSSIFTKDKMSLSNKFKKSYKKTNYFDLIENDKNVIKAYLFILSTTSILYGSLFLLSSVIGSIFAIIIWFFLMMAYMLPLILVAVLIALTYDMIKSIINMRSISDYSTNQIF